jgi:NTE family protein
MADDLLRKTEAETASGGRRRAEPRIGLALGAGSARGWAHIGAVRELVAMGLVPDVVVGSSIGALVGGCFAAGRLDELESFARSLNRRRVFGLLDFSFSGAGLIGGDRLRVRLQESIGSMRIEDLPVRFAGVATELGTGHEVWLRRGSLVDAMRASYALPGVFEPVRIGRRWLIDGAVVNPVPVSVARALGAERVVALSIAVDGTGRGATRHDGIETDPADDEAPAAARRGAGLLRRGRSGASAPGLASVMADAFNITQDRLMRSRLAGDPPDVLINLKVGRIGVFDFDRAEDLIALGREAARRARDEIAECFDLAPAAEG